MAVGLLRLDRICLPQLVKPCITKGFSITPSIVHFCNCTLAIDRSCSTIRPVAAGVHQGSVLSTHKRSAGSARSHVALADDAMSHCNSLSPRFVSTTLFLSTSNRCRLEPFQSRTLCSLSGSPWLFRNDVICGGVRGLVVCGRWLRLFLLQSRRHPTASGVQDHHSPDTGQTPLAILDEPP